MTHLRRIIDHSTMLNSEGIKLFKGKTFDAGHFDSFADYLAFIVKISQPTGKLRANVKGLGDFMGDYLYMSAIVAKFHETRANQKYLAPVSAQEIGFDVSGDFVDVGRYMSGEPECMCMYDTSDRPTKFLTFNIRTAYIGDAFSYYSMVLDLIDYLESAGTRCRIYLELHHNTSPSGWRSKAKIRLKDFSEPLNVHEFCAFFLSEAMNAWAKCSADCILGRGTYGVDGNNYDGDCAQPSDPEEINIPSAWFHRYYNKPADKLDMREYLGELGLSHLLAE